MFELVDYEDEFQKIFTLTVIFETVNIAKSNANSKHVVLHFKNDNEIPRKAFELLAYKHDREESHLKVYHKIVYAFEQFEADNMGKYIFVGSFREFRGLEHSNITLIIDLDIEALRHYLVECIARCTTELNIVVLGSNEILTNITGSWKKNKLVKQWTIKIDDVVENQENELFKIESDEEVIKICKSSKCYNGIKQFFKILSREREEDPNLNQIPDEKLRR